MSVYVEIYGATLAEARQAARAVLEQAECLRKQVSVDTGFWNIMRLPPAKRAQLRHSRGWVRYLQLTD